MSKGEEIASEVSGLTDDLFRTIIDPSSSKALAHDDLARSIGVGGLPSREEAIAILEKEVLAPVRDLNGPDLWRWQM